MPSRQASLLWAREVEGKSYDELCTQFGMTEPAVRSVLTRARKALRREYEMRGGTVPVGGLAVLAPWIAGLNWAEKLRRAANRLTAPAVLGAAGIAALGGLVLSPFGSSHGGTSTFSPGSAVVASSLNSSPTTTHGAAGVTAPVTRRTAAAPVATATSSPLVQQVVHSTTQKIPCTSAGEQGLVVDTRGQLEQSVGAGNDGCAAPPHSVGVPLPAGIGAATGYDTLSVSTDLVSCDQLHGSQTPQLVHCSETQK
jgi:hypothetical protein